MYDGDSIAHDRGGVGVAVRGVAAANERGGERGDDGDGAVALAAVVEALVEAADDEAWMCAYSIRVVWV